MFDLSLAADRYSVHVHQNTIIVINFREFSNFDYHEEMKSKIKKFHDDKQNQNQVLYLMIQIWINKRYIVYYIWSANDCSQLIVVHW